MKTIRFFTLGCKVNQYDTQVMREEFIRAGFKELENSQRADIYLINTCTVTSAADRKSRHLIRYSHRQNPQAKIIVTGCYTELDNDADEIAKIPGVTDIIKNQDKYRILELLNGHSEQNEMNELNNIGISSFSEHTRAFLKIQDGCNNFCSYCKVPLVRGSSRSRPLAEIIQEAQALIKNGYKETVLTGICLGSYGKDLYPNISVVNVIEALEKIRGLLRIRLSSIEAGDVSVELINKISQSKKLCRHLHIPIQSGDDKILKRMNRAYKRYDYLNLINRIKKCIPDIAITTDVMVGFPGEDEINFENTADLIKEIIPLKVHIFPYSPREGTTAYNFKDRLNSNIIKKRTLHLKNIAKNCALDYKKQFLNKDMKVLIETRSKESPNSWEGYTSNYIKVLVKSGQDLKNQLISLRLKKIVKDFMLSD